MFRGVTAINLDDKGRIIIPTRYRETLMEEAEGQMIATIDTADSCLLLYPLPEWERIEEKLADLPSFDAGVRRFQRLMIGHADEMQMDNQGRCLVPSPLREYASLSKQVVLVGQGKKFELWSDGQWQEGRATWLREVADSDASVPAALQQFSL